MLHIKFSLDLAEQASHEFYVEDNTLCTNQVLEMGAARLGPAIPDTRKLRYGCDDVCCPGEKQKKTSHSPCDVPTNELVWSALH